MATNTNVNVTYQAYNRSQAATNQFVKGMQSINRAFLSIVGVGGGIYALRRGFNSITEAYMKQEKAERDLMAALRITDKEYKSTLSSLKQFAAEMQRQTVYGDELILSQMAYAKNLGVTTDKLEAAAKAAIGLSAKYRIDLASAMMLVGRASQGQTQMLTRYGIVLDKSLSDQAKFNELLKIGADAFSLAQEETHNLSGKLQQQANRWGDIKERIAGSGGVANAYMDLLNEIEKRESTIKSWVTTFTQGLAEIVSGFESVRTVNELLNQELENQVKKHPSQLAPGTKERLNAMYGTLGYSEYAGPKAPLAPEEFRTDQIAKGIPADELNRMRAWNYMHTFQGPLPGTEYQALPGTNAGLMSQRRSISRQSDFYEAARRQRDTAHQKERASAAKRMASLSEQVNMEIELMGRLSEPRQHARMAIEYQAEAAKRYGANTKEAIAATEAFAEQLDRLEMAEKWSELADTMENSITNAFDQMIFEGAKFKNVMKQLARDIPREFMRVMVFRTVSQGITGSINSMFAPSAMGNVFDRGRLVPMASGGIIDRPTLLPYAGEAGPEAVMPLKRAASGRLGVEASASAPIINTYTLEPVTVNAQRQNNRWVLDIVANGMTNYGPLKRGVRQAARTR